MRKGNSKSNKASDKAAEALSRLKSAMAQAAAAGTGLKQTRAWDALGFGSPDQMLLMEGVLKRLEELRGLLVNAPAKPEAGKPNHDQGKATGAVHQGKN